MLGMGTRHASAATHATEAPDMAGRTTNAKGRIKESVGALKDDKALKDKGRVEQARGTVKKNANKAVKKVKRAVD